MRKEIAQLEAEHTTLDKQCASTSLAIAKDPFRNFAKDFHAKLPLELRDLVYAHVWDQATLERTFDNVCDTISVMGLSRYLVTKHSLWEIECLEDECICFRWWELPFWAQHQCVGMDIARETVIAYYRAGLPTRFGTQLASINSMLSKDHFHLGIKPADHIRCLELDLTQFIIRVRGARQFEIKDKIVLSEEFQQQVSVLAEVKVKRGFKLHIKTS